MTTHGRTTVAGRVLATPDNTYVTTLDKKTVAGRVLTIHDKSWQNNFSGSDPNNSQRLHKTTVAGRVLTTPNNSQQNNFRGLGPKAVQMGMGWLVSGRRRAPQGKSQETRVMSLERLILDCIFHESTYVRTYVRTYFGGRSYPNLACVRNRRTYVRNRSDYVYERPPTPCAWSILLRRFARTLQERAPSHIIPHIPQVANTLQQVNGAFILFVPFEAPSPKSTCSKNTTDATKAFRANFASLT